MKIFIAAVLACAASVAVQAQAPGKPAVSVHASGIKQLEFRWEPVANALRYELWFRSAPGASWGKYTDAVDDNRVRISASVHLLDWRVARYRVRACNDTQCTDSSEVGVNGEQLVAMGYLKPESADIHHYFGGNIALSADGTTLAVVMGENIGARHDTAVIYIYRKFMAGGQGWMREARLLPSVVQDSTAQTFSGDQIAISGNGNVVAFGSWNESSYKPTLQSRGAVYIFKGSNGTWRQTQRLTGDALANDHYGLEVKLDDGGRRLLISHDRYLDRDGDAHSRRGVLEIFRDPNDDDSNQFQLVRQWNIYSEDTPCGGLAFSGNGRTFVQTCTIRVVGAGYRTQIEIWDNNGNNFYLPAKPDSAIEISYDQKVIIVQDGLTAKAYRKDGIYWKWVPDGELSAVVPGEPGSTKRRIALSRDGKIAAIGIPSNDTPGRGPVYPPYGTDGAPTGAVVVYERKSTGWTVRRVVRPDSTNAQWFGHAVALGDNGRILAVGAPFDTSAATGINGDRNDDSAFERGAVWLY